MSITLNLAEESIDFQSDLFFKNLTLICSTLVGVKEDTIADNPSVGNLSKCIKEFTNMNFVIHLGDQGPSVEIPKVDRNNVLVNNFLKNYINNTSGMALIKDSDKAVRGSVNRKTGKVSGVFSEIAVAMYLPAKLMSSDSFTPEQKASIILHEVGHIETYFEYLSNTITTNQVLAGISKGLLGANSIKEREVILMSAKNALKLKELNTEELSKVTNDKVVEYVVVSSVIRENSSEIGTNIYDYNTWEYLADQYATRMGAGRHLVTALDKIYKSSWNISKRGITTYLSFEAFKLVVLFVSPALGLMLITMDGSGDGTYDRPGARLKRVRNQLVERLKDKALTKDEIMVVTEDIKIIDTVLETFEDRRQFFGLLWDTLSPSARRAYSQEKLQQQLELFAANELFTRSTEFKTMFDKG